ncbi:MAG: helix-turn-helix domain-containing protein [Actinomycetota bacterium]
MSGAVTPERKALVAAALASGASITEAAERCGVARQSIWRWTQTDEAFREMRAGNVTAALAALRDLSLDAASVVAEELQGEDRLRAAALVFRHVPEFAQRLDVQVSTLEARLAELDAAGDTGSD